MALEPRFCAPCLRHIKVDKETPRYSKIAISEIDCDEASNGSDNETKETHTQLTIIAASFAGGQTKSGVDLGPEALLNARLLDRLAAKHYVHDIGHLQTSSFLGIQGDQSYRKLKNPLTVSAYTQSLAAQTYVAALHPDSTTLTLGGDHSIAIGSIAGIAKAIRVRSGQALGVIWIDPHADINTPETTASGNIHGTPVAFLTGLARSDRVDIFGWIEEQHRIEMRNVVYIGLRDVDDGEEVLLEEHGIKRFSMRDVERLGITSVLSQAISYLDATIPLHLSFDIDSLDPIHAPSTGTPVPKGLSLEEGIEIAETIRQTKRLVGMDLVEVNPLLEAGGAERTLVAGRKIIEAALGCKSTN